MTEAELATVEELFKMGGIAEQRILLQYSIDIMRNDGVRFDVAFLEACKKFDVPEKLLAPHRLIIEQARLAHEPNFPPNFPAA